MNVGGFHSWTSSRFGLQQWSTAPGNATASTLPKGLKVLAVLQPSERTFQLVLRLKAIHSKTNSSAESSPVLEIYCFQDWLATDSGKKKHDCDVDTIHGVTRQVLRCRPVFTVPTDSTKPNGDRTLHHNHLYPPARILLAFHGP